MTPIEKGKELINIKPANSALQILESITKELQTTSSEIKKWKNLEATAEEILKQWPSIHEYQHLELTPENIEIALQIVNIILSKVHQYKFDRNLAITLKFHLSKLLGFLKVEKWKMHYYSDQK